MKAFVAVLAALALIAVLAVAGWFGYRAIFKPVPTLDDPALQAKAWVEAAQAQAEEAQQDYDKTDALADIAVFQARAGDAEGSRRTFEAARQIELTAAREKSLTPEIARMDQANGFSTRKSVAAYALSQIAYAQAKVGNLEDGRQTCRDALQIVEGISYDDNIGLMMQILLAQARAGDIVAALRIVKGFTKDDLKDSARKHIATMQARTGNIVGARLTDEGLANNYYQSRFEKELAAAQAREGDIAGGLQTARHLPEGDNLRADALTIIAAAQARAGDPAGSRQTFAEALQSACHPGQTANRDQVRALDRLAAAQARAGDPAGSRQTVAVALGVAQDITDANERTDALAVVAAAQSGAGDPAAALRNIRGIEKGHSDEAKVAIAIVQARAGDHASANATLAKLRSGKDRCHGYLAAAKALRPGPTEPEED